MLLEVLDLLLLIELVEVVGQISATQLDQGALLARVVVVVLPEGLHEGLDDLVLALVLVAVEDLVQDPRVHLAVVLFTRHDRSLRVGLLGLGDEAVDSTLGLLHVQRGLEGSRGSVGVHLRSRVPHRDRVHAPVEKSLDLLVHRHRSHVGLRHVGVARLRDRGVTLLVHVIEHGVDKRRRVERPVLDHLVESFVPDTGLARLALRQRVEPLRGRLRQLVGVERLVDLVLAQTVVEQELRLVLVLSVLERVGDVGAGQAVVGVTDLVDVAVELSVAGHRHQDHLRQVGLVVARPVLQRVGDGVEARRVVVVVELGALAVALERQLGDRVVDVARLLNPELLGQLGGLDLGVQLREAVVDDVVLHVVLEQPLRLVLVGHGVDLLGKRLLGDRGVSRLAGELPQERRVLRIDHQRGEVRPADLGALRPRVDVFELLGGQSSAAVARADRRRRNRRHGRLRGRSTGAHALFLEVVHAGRLDVVSVVLTVKDHVRRHGQKLGHRPLDVGQRGAVL